MPKENIPFETREYLLRKEFWEGSQRSLFPHPSTVEYLQRTNPRLLPREFRGTVEQAKKIVTGAPPQPLVPSPGMDLADFEWIVEPQWNAGQGAKMPLFTKSGEPWRQTAVTNPIPYESVKEPPITWAQYKAKSQMEISTTQAKAWTRWKAERLKAKSAFLRDLKEGKVRIQSSKGMDPRGVSSAGGFHGAASPGSALGWSEWDDIGTPALVEEMRGAALYQGRATGEAFKGVVGEYLTPETTVTGKVVSRPLIYENATFWDPNIESSKWAYEHGGGRAYRLGEAQTLNVTESYIGEKSRPAARKVLSALRAESEEEFQALAQQVPGFKKNPEPLTQAWKSLQNRLAYGYPNFYKGAAMADDILPDEAWDLVHLLNTGELPVYAGKPGQHPVGSLNTIFANFWGFETGTGYALGKGGETTRLSMLDLEQLAGKSKEFYPKLDIRGYGAHRVGAKVAGAVSHRNRLGLQLEFPTGVAPDVAEQISSHQVRLMVGDFAMMEGKTFGQHTVASGFAMVSDTYQKATVGKSSRAGSLYNQLYKRIDEVLVNPIAQTYNLDYNTALNYVGSEIAEIGNVQGGGNLAYVMARLSLSKEAAIHAQTDQVKAIEVLSARRFGFPRLGSGELTGPYANIFGDWVETKELAEGGTKVVKRGLASYVPKAPYYGTTMDASWDEAQSKLFFAMDEVKRWLSGGQSPFLEKKMGGTFADEMAKEGYNAYNTAEKIRRVYAETLMENQRASVNTLVNEYSKRRLGIPVGENAAVNTEAELRHFFRTGEAAYTREAIDETPLAISKFSQQPSAQMPPSFPVDPSTVEVTWDTQMDMTPSLALQGSSADEEAAALERATALVRGQVDDATQLQLASQNVALTAEGQRQVKKQIVDRLAETVSGRNLALTPEDLTARLSTPMTGIDLAGVETAVRTGAAKVVTGAGTMPVEGYLSTGEYLMLSTRQGEDVLNLAFKRFPIESTSIQEVADTASRVKGATKFAPVGHQTSFGYQYDPALTMFNVINQSAVGEMGAQVRTTTEAASDVILKNEMLTALGFSGDSVEGVEVFQKAMRSWWGKEFKYSGTSANKTVLEMLTSGFSPEERAFFTQNIQRNLGLTDDELSAVLNLKGKVIGNVGSQQYNIERMLAVAGAAPETSSGVSFYEAYEQGLLRFLGEDEPAAVSSFGVKHRGGGRTLSTLLRKILRDEGKLPADSPLVPQTVNPLAYGDFADVGRPIDYMDVKAVPNIWEDEVIQANRGALNIGGGTGRISVADSVQAAAGVGEEVADDAARVVEGASATKRAFGGAGSGLKAISGTSLAGLGAAVEETAPAVATAEAAAGGSKLGSAATLAKSRHVQAALAGVGALVLAGAILQQTRGPKGGTPESMPYGDSYPTTDVGMQMPLVQEVAHAPSTLVSMLGSGYTNMKPRGVMYDIRSNTPNPPDVGQFADQLSNLFETDAGVPVRVNTYNSGKSRPTSSAELDDMLARRLSR